MKVFLAQRLQESGITLTSPRTLLDDRRVYKYLSLLQREFSSLTFDGDDRSSPSKVNFFLTQPDVVIISPSREINITHSKFRFIQVIVHERSEDNPLEDIDPATPFLNLSSFPTERIIEAGFRRQLMERSAEIENKKRFDIEVEGRGYSIFDLTITDQLPIRKIFVGEWRGSDVKEGLFESPYGIALSSWQEVYVTDTNNHRVQVFDREGRPILTWGGEGGEIGQFNYPRGIAISRQNDIYVVDSRNHRVQVFTEEGKVITSWGTRGSEDGQFNTPFGIAISPWGDIYVTDTGNRRVQIFSKKGSEIKWSRTWSTKFSFPTGIAIDQQGNVYVVDTNNHRVQVFDRIGEPLGFLGEQFNLPQGIAILPQREGAKRPNEVRGEIIYVADTGNNRIQVFTSGGEFLWSWGNKDESPEEERLNNPRDLAVSRQGRIYVVDSRHHRVKMFDQVFE
jgi:DNA-binding beta-propeller fold protein YncE